MWWEGKLRVYEKNESNNCSLKIIKIKSVM